ncbi:MAG: hypothetical protein KJI71_03820, partial [Patescibacteria group bacterium]|nr:hypothetical protein [Patescibacteria group bacterium]
MSKIINLLLITLLVSFVGAGTILAAISIESNLDFGGNKGIDNLKTLFFAPLVPFDSLSPDSAPDCTSSANKGKMYYGNDNVVYICSGSDKDSLGSGDLQSVTTEGNLTNNAIGVATDGVDPTYGLTVGNSTNLLGIKASGNSLFE